MKQLSIFAFFLLSFILCTFAQPQVYVDPSSSCTSGCGSQNSPYSGLQQALSAIPNGGTITAAPGTYYGGNFLVKSGNYVIQSTQGSTKTIIDCATNGNRNSGFQLTSGTFNIRGFTIQNCSTNGDGGAMSITSSSTTLTDIQFVGNSAGNNGGAVYIYSNSVFMNNVTFINNTATVYGGAMYIQSAFVQMTYSAFYNNDPVFNDYAVFCQSASMTVDQFTNNNFSFPLRSICQSCPVTVVPNSAPAQRSTPQAIMFEVRQNSNNQVCQAVNPPNWQPPTPLQLNQSCGGCCYRFNYSFVPSFRLPTSNGDYQLNAGNPIVRSDGYPINNGQGCNGDFLEYQNTDGSWSSSYTDDNGNQQNNINIFYATAGTALNVRTIQSWQSGLRTLLANRPLRLWITCNNGWTGCIRFTVGGNDDTCPASSDNNDNTCIFLVNRSDAFSSFAFSATTLALVIISLLLW